MEINYIVAIDIIGTHMDKSKDKVFISACKLAVEGLEKQLSNRWIPVNERLPEDYGTYLVAWRPTSQSADDVRVNTESDLTHYYEMLAFDPNDESGWLDSIEQCKEYVILAWRNLPEAYKD